MKFKKFALSAVITFCISALSNTATAVVLNEQKTSYALNAAEKYIVPKLSRDLGKNVKVIAHPNKKPSLELVISNATCKDYSISFAFLGGNMYVNETVLDMFEEDKTLTIERLDKEYKFILGPLAGASQVLMAGLLMNPEVLMCFKQRESELKRDVESFTQSYMEKLNMEKRSNKLKAEGRLK